MDKEITSTTTSVSAMSGIPWKKVRKLVKECIESGANVTINCDADGFWNIAIYPPEKQEKITVPDGDGTNTIPYIQPIGQTIIGITPYQETLTTVSTCNTGENNG